MAIATFLPGLVLFVANCQPRAESANDNRGNVKMSATPESAATPSQNLDELARVVNLPLRPQTAVWQRKRLGGNQVSDIPGPSDWNLTAVLRYSDEDAEKVAAAAAKHETAAPDEAEIEEWFPAELRKLAEDSATTPKTIAGQRYRADDFRRAPLLSGSLIRIGKTGYFVLRLFTA
jgi:hypothetical protein